MDTSQDLVIIQNDVPLADSRVVAEKLGVQHAPFMTNVITKYQEVAERRFGSVHFENGPKLRGHKGGDPPKFALLNEGQSYFHLSLAKNTDRAVECKAMLVEAFLAAKKITLHEKVTSGKSF